MIYRSVVSNSTGEIKPKRMNILFAYFVEPPEKLPWENNPRTIVPLEKCVREGAEVKEEKKANKRRNNSLPSCRRS